jgi:hypothetical protein
VRVGEAELRWAMQQLVSGLSERHGHEPVALLFDILPSLPPRFHPADLRWLAVKAIAERRSARECLSWLARGEPREELALWVQTQVALGQDMRAAESFWARLAGHPLAELPLVKLPCEVPPTCVEAQVLDLPSPVGWRGREAAHLPVDLVQAAVRWSPSNVEARVFELEVAAELSPALLVAADLECLRGARQVYLHRLDGAGAIAELLAMAPTIGWAHGAVWLPWLACRVDCRCPTSSPPPRPATGWPSRPTRPGTPRSAGTGAGRASRRMAAGWPCWR